MGPSGIKMINAQFQYRNEVHRISYFIQTLAVHPLLHVNLGTYSRKVAPFIFSRSRKRRHQVIIKYGLIWKKNENTDSRAAYM